MLSLSILKSFLTISLDSVKCFPWSSIVFIFFFPWSSIVFICFSKFFPKGEYVNLADSIILFWSEGSVSSTVSYSYLSFGPDNNAHIFGASLLITYCSFSSLILSSIVIISFYILSKRFSLKHEKLSDAKVASITKKRIRCCSIFFITIHKFSKVNIWWMNKCS